MQLPKVQPFVTDTEVGVFKRGKKNLLEIRRMNLEYTCEVR